MGKWVMQCSSVNPWKSSGTIVTAVSSAPSSLSYSPLKLLVVPVWKQTEKAGILFSSEIYVIEDSTSTADT